jgi:two-component system, NarL family, response regulator LiaR
MVIRRHTRKIDIFPYENLTNRELEILCLAAQGKSNKKVAAQLNISVRTVENHLHNIYEKIYVYSRTEAAVWAIEKGIVTPRINK